MSDVTYGGSVLNAYYARLIMRPSELSCIAPLPLFLSVLGAFLTVLYHETIGKSHFTTVSCSRIEPFYFHEVSKHRLPSPFDKFCCVRSLDLLIRSNHLGPYPGKQIIFGPLVDHGYPTSAEALWNQDFIDLIRIEWRMYSRGFFSRPNLLLRDHLLTHSFAGRRFREERVKKVTKEAGKYIPHPQLPSTPRPRVMISARVIKKEDKQPRIIPY